MKEKRLEQIMRLKTASLKKCEKLWTLPRLLLQVLNAIAKELGQDTANELCTAACKAQHAPEKEDRTKQHGMARQFSQTHKDSENPPNEWVTPPAYQPNNKKILPEVSQKIPNKKGGAMETLLSCPKNGEPPRTVPGTNATAPMSMMKAMRGSEPGNLVTRWDFVIPKDPNKAAKDENISKYVEVKFPKDKLTENQKAARRAMASQDPPRNGDVVEMAPADDCECSQDGKKLNW